MKPRPASSSAVTGLTEATAWIQPLSRLERHVDRGEEEDQEDRELHQRPALDRAHPHRHPGRPHRRASG